MSKLGQEPAFPCEKEYLSDTGSGLTHREFLPGINKRFYAACAAMQGLLMKNGLGLYTDNRIDNAKSYVKSAYMIADELLKQENE